MKVFYSREQYDLLLLEIDSMVCTVREISTNFFLACCEARPSRVWRFENVSAGSDDAGYDRTQQDSTTNGSLSKDTQGTAPRTCTQDTYV